MRDKLIVNDVHIGVLRSGGTTMATAAALRDYLLRSFRDFIMQHLNKDLVLNGDIFDAFNVPLSDALALYVVLVEWIMASDGTLESGLDGAPQIVLGRGNHDIAKDNSKLSSFDLLAALLGERFPDRVKVVIQPAMLDDGIYMIPHMPNQELFDLELSRIPSEAKLVLVHANYDNGYTVEADHSLNVSREQAEKIAAAGQALIFGHEHQAREALDGQVFITGNQWPSSIADCLNNPHMKKHAHVISADFTGDFTITPIETWDGTKQFAELQWDQLDDKHYDFVRVVGSASASQAADVIAAIAKYRQQSKAFVVTNAVKIEGVSEMADLPASVEDVKAFDVLGFLYEQLEPKQVEVIKALRAKRLQLKEAA